jgi:hypothetical protein
MLLLLLHDAMGGHTCLSFANTSLWSDTRSSKREKAGLLCLPPMLLLLLLLVWVLLLLLLLLLAAASGVGAAAAAAACWCVAAGEHC